MDDITPEVSKSSFFRSHKVLYLVFLVFFVGIFIYHSLSAPTANRSIVNKQGVMIHISKNESLSQVALELEEKGIIKYDFALKIFVTLFGSANKVPRGDYLFTETKPVWSVAWMLARGDHHIDPIKITFREGMTNESMAELLSSKLPSFRKDLFISDERTKQGYLFPDTYFFFPLTSSDEIVDEMSQNFKKRLAPLEDKIRKSGHSLDEVITMASIIELEADGTGDAPTIAGILWKRINKGMLLQVDAAPRTYKTLGLPDEPIANPGLVSIKAALEPKDSSYLFYLHDKSGMVHYASTYGEHKNNINRYLK
jgi:UPF0755 protein